MLVGKPPFETPDVKTTYKKIRMNSYSFPEHVPLSDAAKSLITKILNLDPSRRPTLDEILEHPFINHGGTIPKLLPVSTIACPPSASYIKQFLPQGSTVKLTVQPQRLIDTAPQSQPNSAQLPSSQRGNLVSTEKISDFKPRSPEEDANKLNKQSSKEGLNLPGATMQFNMTNGSNMKDTLRSTNNQKDMKSSQGLKTAQMTGFTSPNGVGGSISSGNRAKPSGRNEVWVKKWVDYSSKYGLGYLLSNNSIGVFFNDSTKIILDANGSTFEYMERKSNEKQDIVTTHSLTEYSKELQKKVTLLQHFKSYLEGENNKDPQSAEDEGGQGASGVYVKKWMKTKHAIMFRLSNKIVQVNFTDKTEIILSSENKIVTYVNKKGERSNYPLATALESSNSEMAKRLKYTKEILTHMLNNNGQAQTQQQQTANMPEMN